MANTSTLVIVESPAKAKTIAGYLGSGYDVQASFGHVRDLPERADEVPAEYKGVKWAKLGVNVDEDFQPLYVVPDDKKRHVDALKKAAKGAKALILATDEDREGESISWHILQLLQPAKATQVKRIVFHEITPEAIQEALKNPRTVDEDLVRAQETRRILDRLYGYTISPVLWRKVAPKLSAGRVQSVAVKLLVDRERERMAFKRSSWWDLEALLEAGAEGNLAGGSFTARLIEVGGKRLATGKSFDSTTGALTEKDAVLLDEAKAAALAAAAQTSKPWRVKKVESRPETERPPVPFMTSTLQQEANRKLRFASKRTMQIAQQLYEGIELGGERIGLITYMRTDSLTLSERALSQCRHVIQSLYGKEYLPAEPVRYRTKSKNAQEAHEAIRPSDLGKKPEDLRQYLDADQLKLYELIWKRTIACQMVPARVQRTTVHVEVTAPTASASRGEALLFTASGKQITFPGFLRAYVEGSDDPEAELESKEAILPPLSEGKTLAAKKVLASGHETKPPARLTEASLVKKLEEAGVGRPSTYASIISTIQDRGYVFKNGNELVPTFTAFAVSDLLSQHFEELVDLKFTARMEDELDEIAEGKRDWSKHLASFYRGDDGGEGLVRRVEERTPEIPFPAIPVGKDPETGEPMVIRVGRFGTYAQRGEGGKGNTASIPEDAIPADLSAEKVAEMIRAKSAGPVPIGKDPATGRDVVLRTGRFGNYIEVKQTEAEAESGEKPRRVSLPEGLDPKSITADDVKDLLQFPRALGKHPEKEEEVVVKLGRYGAYVSCEESKETRNIAQWRDALRLTMKDALTLLAQPKQARRRGAAPAKPPLRELGKLEGAAGPVRILEGRYGSYVTDGETNATLPKGVDPMTVSPEECMSLLRARQGAPKKAKRGRGRFAARTSPKESGEAAPAKASRGKASAKAPVAAASETKAAKGKKSKG